MRREELNERILISEEKERKSVFRILATPLKHLCRILGITGVRIVSHLFFIIALIARLATYCWLILMAIMFVGIVIMGMDRDILPPLFYVLMVGLTLGILVIYNLIQYVSAYLFHFADTAEERLSPKTTPTTEKQTVYVVFQDERAPSSGDGEVIEGEFTEI